MKPGDSIQYEAQVYFVLGIYGRDKFLKYWWNRWKIPINLHLVMSGILFCIQILLEAFLFMYSCLFIIHCSLLVNTFLIIVPYNSLFTFSLGLLKRTDRYLWILNSTLRWKWRGRQMGISRRRRRGSCCNGHDSESEESND